jgi:hypothetical protein
MAIKTGNSLGMEVLKVLGIDHRMVIGLTIDMQAGQMATVTITRGVTDDEAAELRRVLENYALERKPEDPSAKAMETLRRNLTRG